MKNCFLKRNLDHSSLLVPVHLILPSTRPTIISRMPVSFGASPRPSRPARVSRWVSNALGLAACPGVGIACTGRAAPRPLRGHRASGVVTWERNLSTVPDQFGRLVNLQNNLFQNAGIRDDSLWIPVHLLIKYHLSNKKQKTKYISDFHFASWAHF